jgi:hypothetical protein
VIHFLHRKVIDSLSFFFPITIFPSSKSWVLLFNVPTESSAILCGARSLTPNAMVFKGKVEAVIGLGNFGKDQRDLAMEHYKRDRRGEAMPPAATAAVSVPALLTDQGLARSKLGRAPLVTRQWPVFRGFAVANARPLVGAPPIAPPKKATAAAQALAAMTGDPTAPATSKAGSGHLV